MKALQYIYTSWRNGDSPDKGYMIYSRSEGITEEECMAIKIAMQYLAPKELNLAPSPQEIEEVFPYSFAYFLLPQGRQCVAQSTYLGKDYSGRFGNYIIYALIFEPGQMECRPAELFAEPYIKTFMTEEELNASSPVPPLPPLEITEYGSVIHDEQLGEFVFEREEEFAKLISGVLAARDRGVPLYINDTRENLVQWAAAVQRVLPDKLAQKFYFNTYAGNHEAMSSPKAKELGLDFYLLGVRPDANYFQYAVEYQSSRHIVMDFIGGYMTQEIPVGKFAKTMAASAALGFEEADEFSLFLNSTTLDVIDKNLEDAYRYYCFLKREELEDKDASMDAIIRFGFQYCSEETNSDVGSRFLVRLQEDSDVLQPKRLYRLWLFVCKYTDFMIFSLYELVLESIYQIACDIKEPCRDLEDMLKRMETKTPSEYRGMMEYLNSPDSVQQMLLFLEGHTNPYTNLFYLDWIMKSYKLEHGIRGREPICKLLQKLFANISRTKEKSYLIHMLFSAARDKVMFESILYIVLKELHGSEQMERLCRVYSEIAEKENPEIVKNFEQRLFGMTDAQEFVILLFAHKIRESGKPEEEFWSLYRRQKAVREKGSFPIDPMVMACLEVLEDQAKEKAAIRMVEELDFCDLQNVSSVDTLMDIFGRNKVKTLIKLDPFILQKACRFQTEAGSTVKMEKVEAILAGKQIQEAKERVLCKISLRDEEGKASFTLNSFDKSDYETYIKSFLGEYMEYIQSSEDVETVMKIFYNQKFYNDFTDSYMSWIAKLRKKDEAKWRHLLFWTGNFLIIAQKDSVQKQETEDLFLKYLEGLNEEDVCSLRNRLAKKLPESQVEAFFGRIHHRRGVQERLGSFFRRK